MKNLERLNKRYGSTNLTGFKFVTGETSLETFLRHFELDLRILNSSSIDFKHVGRVVIRKNVVDIQTVDNGTYVSYVFCSDAKFCPRSIKSEIKEICKPFEILTKVEFYVENE